MPDTKIKPDPEEAARKYADRIYDIAPGERIRDRDSIVRLHYNYLIDGYVAGHNSRNDDFVKLQERVERAEDLILKGIGQSRGRLIRERDTALEKVKRLEGALRFYEPILRKFGCSPRGDHDDPTWCNETCNDYGKSAREALNDP